MRNIRPPALTVLAAAILLSSLPAIPVPAAPPGAPGASAAALVDWRLVDARVVSAGRTFADNQGLRMTGYAVEATAVTTDDGAPFLRGTFRMTLEAFRPKADMPGQTAGRWYAAGTWTITDANADPREAAVRYNPSVVRGHLAAELPFNPASGVGRVEGRIRLRNWVGGPRGPGFEGTFAGNEKFEGTIFLNGKR